MNARICFISAIFLLGLLMPAVSSASTLSAWQVSAIISLLRAFDVEQSVIARVEQSLGGSAEPVVASSPVISNNPPRAYAPPEGSLYPSGALGYDISFNTKSYPADSFGFAVIGVSGGRAFTDNQRISSEYLWARNFATRAMPTVYMNLNAPYGSSATGTNLSGPKTCDTLFTASSSPAEPKYPEPTLCASYNYGYRAAEHAFSYATDHGISSPIWWLDIEEANSWSYDRAVNDSTIQGAIDYLNGRGVRVGIYSTTRMWREIAGEDFAPAETIGGKTVLIPSWFPIGIANRTEAINACHTANGFTPNSVPWIIQYEESATAVDQNIAC